ncbi:MAG TPA: RsmE family RNA methyltransferase, partial [Candidatus Synoicihabitans sp.]|nr:RsmE family RNA methyltransferase [Candidatus Synoicihabitans sp.]
MPDFRAFCRPSEREPQEIELSEEEAHHLVNVNRARVGDTVVVFDGRGTEWISELQTVEKRRAALEVRFSQKAKPLAYEITLGQALPKGSFMDAIVR